MSGAVIPLGPVWPGRRWHGRRSRRSGFTLLELLVAISIFTVLGLLLVMTLRAGIGAWQRGEQVRGLYESARVITRQLSRDLEATFPQKMAAEQRRDIRFYSDFDGNQRQRLMFVRTLGADERNQLTWAAGSGTIGQGHTGFYDRHNDAAKKLRPHGGLAEVAYVMDPEAGSFTLFRGLRAPVGFPGSLLNPASLAKSEQVQQVLHPLSRDVLYLRFVFWSVKTRSWDDGIESHWDSTRGIIPLDQFSFFNDGLAQLDDDVWPLKVRIVMTLRGEGDAAATAFLTADVGPTDKRIKVTSTRGFPDPEEANQGFVLIGTEWIALSEIDGNTLVVRKRGARGTVAAAHGKESTRSVTYFAADDTAKKLPLRKTVTTRTRVHAGRTFSFVRDLPSVGEFGR